MAGRSRSQRGDTVAWEQPEIPAATSWVKFLRISVATIATGNNDR
jgi:hypothetical protein